MTQRLEATRRGMHGDRVTLQLIQNQIGHHTITVPAVFPATYARICHFHPAAAANHNVRYSSLLPAGSPVSPPCAIRKGIARGPQMAVVTPTKPAVIAQPCNNSFSSVQKPLPLRFKRLVSISIADLNPPITVRGRISRNSHPSGWKRDLRR